MKKSFKILLLCLLSNQPIWAEKFVVRIEKFVKQLDEEESKCEFINWESKLENTCICAILKSAQSVFRGDKTASSVIQKATSSLKCTDAIVQKLRTGFKETGKSEETLKKFIQFLFDKYVVIKSVTPKKVLFDKSGNFTVASLKNFLEQAYKEKKLPEAFRSVECLDSKDLVEEKAGAPWSTGQLFLVKSDCVIGKKSSFIVKEMKEHPVDEVYRLARAENYTLLEPLIFPNKLEHYPQLIFPIAYLSYVHNFKKHQLSLLDMAPGVQLSSFVKKFKNSPDDPKLIDEIKQAYYDLGLSMANFYKKYMEKTKKVLLGKTIVHGDLHYGNIFYDAKTRLIVLIDNERIAKSIGNPTDIAEDLAFLLIKSLYVTKWTTQDFFKNFPFKKWYSIVLSSFIEGFVSTYDQSERLDIFNEVKKRLVNFVDSEKGINWYTDKTIIGVALGDYMKPVFQKIKGKLTAEKIGAEKKPVKIKLFRRKLSDLNGKLNGLKRAFSLA